MAREPPAYHLHLSCVPISLTHEGTGVLERLEKGGSETRSYWAFSGAQRPRTSRNRLISSRTERVVMGLIDLHHLTQ